MRGFIILVMLCLLVSIISDLYIVIEIEDIRHDMVELKKDFSYDPKDAK